MPSDPEARPDFPLNALRAFEAAARLGGFAAAAAELGVTPAAITAHIKGLEDRLGAALFDRQARGVRLTALGRSVLPGLTGAFDQLGTVQNLLRVAARPDRLTVATRPGMAAAWLAGRHAALEASMPGLRVAVELLDRAPPHKRGAHDLWLFPGPAGLEVTAAHPGRQARLAANWIRAELAKG